MARAAFIVSVIALVGAWAGPAVAERVFFTGKDVKNGSLTGRDIKNRSLKGRDMKSNSVTGRVVSGLTGRDIARDSIDGSDIAEETLDIQRARSAETADKVNGARPARLHAFLAPNEAVTVLDANGLTLAAACGATGTLSLTAATTGGPAAIRVSGVHRSGGSPVTVWAKDDDFNPGENFDALAGATDNLRADLVFAAADGATVTASFLAEQGLARPAGPGCLVAGTATAADA